MDTDDSSAPLAMAFGDETPQHHLRVLLTLPWESDLLLHTASSGDGGGDERWTVYLEERTIRRDDAPSTESDLVFETDLDFGTWIFQKVAAEPRFWFESWAIPDDVDDQGMSGLERDKRLAQGRLRAALGHAAAPDLDDPAHQEAVEIDDRLTTFDPGWFSRQTRQTRQTRRRQREVQRVTEDVERRVMAEGGSEAVLAEAIRAALDGMRRNAQAAMDAGGSDEDEDWEPSDDEEDDDEEEDEDDDDTSGGAPSPILLQPMALDLTALSADQHGTCPVCHDVHLDVVVLMHAQAGSGAQSFHCICPACYDGMVQAARSADAETPFQCAVCRATIQSALRLRLNPAVPASASHLPPQHPPAP